MLRKYNQGPCGETSTLPTIARFEFGYSSEGVGRAINNYKSSEYLLQHVDNSCEIAAENGNIAFLKALLTPDLYNKSIVRHAKENFGYCVHLAACHNHTTIINYLCAQSPSLDLDRSYVKSGKSPLMAAAESGHLEAVECLLEHHANASICNAKTGSDKKTALTYSIEALITANEKKDDAAVNKHKAIQNSLLKSETLTAEHISRATENLKKRNNAIEQFNCEREKLLSSAPSLASPSPVQQPSVAGSEAKGSQLSLGAAVATSTNTLFSITPLTSAASTSKSTPTQSGEAATTTSTCASSVTFNAPSAQIKK